MSKSKKYKSKKVKIFNISASSIYNCYKGNRKVLDKCDAVLSDSLFTRHILIEKFNEKNEKIQGITVNKSNRTKDIICVTFGYGSVNEEKMIFKEIMKKIGNKYDKKNLKELFTNIISSFLDNDGLDKLLEYYEDDDVKRVIVECYNIHKKGYDGLNAQELMKEFYENGCTIKWKETKKDGSIEENPINYKMLCRSTSKAKKAEIMFINELYYVDTINWLTMGLYNKLPKKNAKIVELSAYATLVCSSMINSEFNTLNIKPNQILIIDDVTTTEKVKAMVIKNKEATKTIEVEGKGCKKIKKEVKYQTCYVDTEDTMSENTLFDGQGLLDVSMFPSELGCSFVLTRNHFWKSALFNTNIVDFFKDWCSKNNEDYETKIIEDMFGNKLKLKDIKCIVSSNTVKFGKFKDIMGDNPYEYWKCKIEEDECMFSIVKNDHPSKYGENQRMSYQMINTLPVWDYAKDSKKEVSEVIKGIANTSISQVNDMKSDNKKFIEFLRKTSNCTNINDIMIDLYLKNEDFAKCDKWLEWKTKIISNYKNSELMTNAKIQNHGDNLTIIMQPLAMLYQAIEGKDGYLKDHTLEDNSYDYITVSTKQFDNDKYIACFRNPHNSPNGIIYAHNIYNDELDKWFNFNKNIIVVAGGVHNHSTWQDSLNSADQDSDFVFSTDNEETVGCAKIAFRDYYPIINKVELLSDYNKRNGSDSEDVKGYGNTMKDYANMDIKFSKSRYTIGLSSNVAQKAMSYYWTAKKNNSECQKDLLNNVAILATLAQLAIDGCKREYVVDVEDEINNILKQDCMVHNKTILIQEENDSRFVNKNQDLPKFMARIKKQSIIAKNKADKESQEYKIDLRTNTDIECPMNMVIDYIDKNIKYKKERNKADTVIPIKELIDFDLKDNNYSKKNTASIESIITLYDNKLSEIRQNTNLNDEDKAELKELAFEEMIESIRKVKIKDISTYLHLIAKSLGLLNGNAKIKNRLQKKMLIALYNKDKNRFLQCFKSKI